MKFLPPEMVYPDDRPFLHDVLSREHFGQSLLGIVENTNEPLVISLNAPWGEGKTTFIKMWQGMLNLESIPNIYFDAFTNDYIDNAFISIASVITEYAKNNIQADNANKVNEFLRKSAKAGSKLLSLSAKVGVNSLHQALLILIQVVSKKI